MARASRGRELEVVTTLTAGHGYWIRKNNMATPRSDFQAIYVAEEEENKAVNGTDLTGKVGQFGVSLRRANTI